MASIQRCRQCKFDCFAYVKGKCIALQDTKFPEDYECPFYKNRNTMPNFFEYFEKYIERKEYLKA